MNYTSEDQIPYGYCHCGCGQKTKIAKKSHTRNGHVRGQPLKYLSALHHSVAVRKTQVSRFWDKIAITADDNQCWLWIGGCDTHGYGNFFWNSKLTVTSRIAWMYPDYIIPKGMCICHSCDNPLCCNPKHLWLGSFKDNSQDREKKGRGRWKTKKHE